MMTERAWLIEGDNTEIYDRLGDVQAVITDPPYGEFAHSKIRTARLPNGQIDEVPIPFVQLTEENARSLGGFMKSKCEGWTLIFSEAEQISDWRGWVEDPERVRPRYFRPMIWVKLNAKPNIRGHGPGMGYETIQTYWCGPDKSSWNGGGKVGVFIHNRSFKTIHPTEKPLPLMKELVRLFSNPGDVVFDPFMGSGSTGVAALELGRRFIGVEKDPEYFATARARIAEVLAKDALLPLPDTKMPTLLGNPVFGSAGTKRRLAREAAERDQMTLPVPDYLQD